MLIDRGVSERVIDHWDYRIELGTSPVVLVNWLNEVADGRVRDRASIL